MSYCFAFLLPFLLVFALMPPAVKLAKRYDFTDKPTERKIHPKPVPLIGGVVMYLSFAVGFLLFVVRDDPRMSAILLGGLMLLVIGIADDHYKTQGREFPVAPRMITHIAAAVLAFAVGIRFTGVYNPFAEQYLTFPIGLQFILTVLWITGLITVINFMDGLDGLAGGLCVLSGFTLFVVALIKGQPDSALFAACLLGAALGFLRFNLPPPRVYMGDSGAYLLGYLLGIMSLYGAFKQATIISVFVPVLALGVPIFDSVLVVVRRFLARKPVYEADSSKITHLHYRLLNHGMKPKHAVGFIFLISACLNLTSIIILLIFNTP